MNLRTRFFIFRIQVSGFRFNNTDEKSKAPDVSPKRGASNNVFESINKSKTLTVAVSIEEPENLSTAEKVSTDEPNVIEDNFKFKQFKCGFNFDVVIRNSVNGHSSSTKKDTSLKYLVLRAFSDPSVL